MLKLIGFIAMTGLVLGLSVSAKANDLDDYVNAKIKEEFFKQDYERARLTIEIPQPQGEDLQVVPQWQQPMNSKDPSIDRLDPTTVGEQPGNGERIQPGIPQKLDPADPVEQHIADQQAYDLYREHYRGAVQKEFLRRLRNAGYTTQRDIAAEIKAKEDQLQR